MNIIASVKAYYREIVNYYNFLITKERRTFTILIILLIINSFLEIIGIASLIPLVNTIINFENSEVVNFITSFKYFSSLTELEMKLTVLFLFITLFAFKTTYAVLLNFFQNSFVANLGNRVSKTMLKSLIQKPYEYYQDKNSSFFVKLFQTEINTFVNYSQALFIYLTELAIVLLICISVTIYNPSISFVMLFVTSISFLLYNFITKSKVFNWGVLRNNNDQILYKLISDFFSGIKEIKLNDSIEFLKMNIHNKFLVKSRLHRNFSTLNAAPRYYYEFFLVFTIIIFFSVLILLNNDLRTIAVFSSIFIASSLKVIPSMNRITSASQTLKFSLPAITLLSKYLQKITIKDYNIIEFKDSILLKNISMNYDSNQLFNNQSLLINKGDKILITGESGSGKTTFADIISMLRFPTTGDIFIDKVKINERSIISNLRYVTQNPFFMDDTILNNIHMDIKSVPDKKLIIKLIKLFGLESLLKDNGLNSFIGENAQKISGGQKQRLALVRALYDNPKILILDEFTSGLDEETERKVFTILFKEYSSLTIIAVSHKLKQKIYFEKEINISNQTLVEYKLN